MDNHWETSNLRAFFRNVYTWLRSWPWLVKSCWVASSAHFCFGRFHQPFLEDPLKLGQIVCGLSVNCELQVSLQIFHSNFQALAGPLRVSQSLVPKPLVLAECFGLLPCWKVNFWLCASLILCNGACFSFSVHPVLSSDHGFLNRGQFPNAYD